MNDDFEQHLRRQPLRQVPAAWQSEMLSVARPAPRTSRLRELLSTFNYQPLTALRWSALTAVWVIILALNHAARDTTPILTAKSTPPSPQMLLALRQQQKLLTELIEPQTASAVADRPKPNQPRSQRRNEFTTV